MKLHHHRHKRKRSSGNWLGYNYVGKSNRWYLDEVVYMLNILNVISDKQYYHIVDNFVEPDDPELP